MVINYTTWPIRVHQAARGISCRRGYKWEYEDKEIKRNIGIMAAS